MWRTLHSFRFAASGIQIALKEEPNFLVEIMFSAFAIAAVVVFDLSALERAMVVFSAGVLLATELINTAIEDVCNKIEPNLDHAIKKIKDIMAASVLVVSVATISVWIIVLYPHVREFLSFV